MKKKQVGLQFYKFSVDTKLFFLFLVNVDIYIYTVLLLLL